jgi:hypothetical protein
MKQRRNKHISFLIRCFHEFYHRFIFAGGIFALLLIITGADQEISKLDVPTPVVANCEKQTEKTLHCEMNFRHQEKSVFKLGNRRT